MAKVMLEDLAPAGLRDALDDLMAEVDSDFDYSQAQERFQELDQIVMGDSSAGRKTTKEWSNLNRQIATYDSLKGYYDSILVDINATLKEADAEYVEVAIPILIDDIRDFMTRASNFLDDTKSKGKYDHNDAIITIQTIGNSAITQSFVIQLAEAYKRFATDPSRNYGFEILDHSNKEVTFRVSGDRAYSLLRGEDGVHSFVFEEGKRPYTDTLNVTVNPYSERAPYKLRKRDVREEALSGSTNGGANANCNHNCIRLTHEETGTQVRVNTRSQSDSRRLAYTLLYSKLAKQQEEEQRKGTESSGDLKARGGYLRKYRLMHREYVIDKVSNIKVEGREQVLNVLQGNGLAQFIMAHQGLKANYQ
jgi:protein subunit release factor A